MIVYTWDKLEQLQQTKQAVQKCEFVIHYIDKDIQGVFKIRTNSIC